MHPPILEVRNLRASHGRREVLHGVDLIVDEPSVVLLGGANGAGKSTLLRCIATLHPSRGSICVGGRRGLADETGAPAIGYLPQAPEFPERFRVADMLRYQAYLSEVEGSDVEATIGSKLRTLGIEALADRRLRALSGGERRLVHVAAILLGSPKVVLVDEPSAELDAHHSVALRAALAAEAEHAAVIVVTHAPDDYELLADRVVYLRGGTVAFDGRRDDFLPLGDHPDDPDHAGDGPVSGRGGVRRSRAELAIAAIEAEALA